MAGKRYYGRYGILIGNDICPKEATCSYIDCNHRAGHNCKEKGLDAKNRKCPKCIKQNDYADVMGKKQAEAVLKKVRRGR